MQRVSDPQVSPDGKWVAFSVRDTDYDANKGRYDVWLAAVDGSSVQPAHDQPERRHGRRSGRPTASGCTSCSTRSGSAQVWRIQPTGGEAEQVTKLDDRHQRLPADARRQAARARDRRLAGREVARRLGEARRGEGRSRRSRRASTTSCCSATGTRGRTASTRTCSRGRVDAATVRDLTPGITTDTPTHPFGGMEEIAISPDGKGVAYVARVGGREARGRRTPTSSSCRPTAAASRRHHRRRTRRTTTVPRSRPTASRSRTRDEAPRLRGRSHSASRSTTSRRRKLRVLTEDWDRSAGELAWSARRQDDLHDCRERRQRVAVRGRRRDRQRRSRSSRRARTTIAAASPATAIVFAQRHADACRPSCSRCSPTAATSRQVTHFNDARVKDDRVGRLRAVLVQGRQGRDRLRLRDEAGGLQPAARCPVAFLIHGGPQG